MAALIEQQKVHPITGETGTFYEIQTDDGTTVGTTWSQKHAVRLMKRAEAIDAKANKEPPEKPEDSNRSTHGEICRSPEPPEDSHEGEERECPALYDYIERTEPFYTIEMFIGDTGEDHEEIWKEAFIDKSTNFLETGEPTATETPQKSDRGLAHDLYAKARGHGDAIAHEHAGKIKGEVRAQTAAYRATAYATIPGKVAEYVKENTISLADAIKKVETDAEDQKDEGKEQQKAEIQAQTDNDQAENDATREKQDGVREDQLKENFDSGDKHCADGPDKVVALVNNSVTDFIQKTLLQEEQYAKVERDNIDADVDSKVKAEGEEKVSKANAATMETARNIVAMKKKLKDKVGIIADKTKQCGLLKIFALIGA